MKRLLLNFMLIGSALLTACNGGGNVTYKYGEDEMFEKVWETKVVHNESCVMIEDNLGVRSARLLYEPSKIIAVKDFTLKKDYEPHEYYVSGDRIYMTPTSTMPYLTRANVACEVVPEVIGGTYEDGKGGHILFTEGVGIVYHQIMVTYEHNDTWHGTIPQKLGHKLPRLQQKLANKEDIRLVINGDSIFTGANSSGVLGIEPFVPGFPDAFVSEITRRYGCNVIAKNTAVGGTLSSWGRDNVVANVNQYNPDLVVIGFGMNDGSWNISPADFEYNIDFMVRSIQANCPNAEIIIISSLIPNPYSAQMKGQADYLPGLLNIANTYQGVACLDMTTFSQDLFEIKNSFELYANNINHPCDFLARSFVANLMHLIEVEK